MPPLLSIVLIGYNNKRFLKPCLGALRKQTIMSNIIRANAKRHKVEIWYIDNASSDDSVEWILRHHPEVKVVANRKNMGYAAAANQGIRMTQSKYVMILNPDLILTADYLKIALARMGKNPRLAAITGKILKYDFEKDEPTSRIDTTGLQAYKSRRVVDRGQGKEDRGQYDQEEEVFGVSGAGPIYRREALEDVKIPLIQRSSAGRHGFFSATRSAVGLVPEQPREQPRERGALNKSFDIIETPYPSEYKPYEKVHPVTKRNLATGATEYLDEDFFMYKEDVDLAWRLRLRGWQSLYVPHAVGYHGRGTGALERNTLLQIASKRRALNRFQKYYSYKNYYLLQVKNDLSINVLKHLPFIVLNELLRTLHTLFREPYLFKALIHTFIQLPRMLKKRKIIMARRTATAAEIACWFHS